MYNSTENMQQTITSVVDTISKLSQDATTAISNTATKYGPDIITGAEKFIRLTAVINTFQWGLVFLLSLAFYFVAYKVFAYNDKHNYELTNDSSTFLFMVFLLSCGIGIFLMVLSLVNILSMDNILSLVSPKFELVNMAKNAITKSGD